mmetsp:Transcript_24537/g.69981  ORF Transcript_24537/g.69981 Transcript_24537/m.69981 type:complete len:218 (-) Transcript_24537:661-1314(-)
MIEILVDLLPQSLQTDIGIPFLLHDLCNSHFKVFLSDMHPSLSQSKHTSFCTNCFTFSTTGISHFLSNDLEIDISKQVHLSRVDLHNSHTIIHVRVREFDLSVNTSGSKQGGIQNINTIGSHDNLDVLGGFKTIQLIQKFQHCSLNLGVSTTSPFTTSTRATDRVNFIHKNDGRSGLTGHDEEFTDHPATFTDVFLHQFRTRNTNKGTVGVVSHRSG